MNRLFVFLFFFGGVVYAQHQDKVDFTYADAYVSVLLDDSKIEGTVTYRFKVLKDVDSVFLDAKNMKFGYVSLNDEVAIYERTDEVIVFRDDFKANQSYTIGLGFEAQPKQTVYFLNTDQGIGAATDQTDATIRPIKGSFPVASANQQIWTQGQGKYTSHWLPSFDDMEEKVEFDLTINADATQQVIANGVLIDKRLDNKDRLSWTFDMKKPMSSYLLAFVIGDYAKEEIESNSGIVIENYYYPQDSLRVEPTYRYTKEIFDFLETEIGILYPWQNYKQIPVRDFLYAGMENTTATVFSDGYVIDSIAFVDKNYVNVNAHELAHQWFGNLVTEKDGEHHWLHEGFATYYAYLAEQRVFGDDHFYWKLRTTMVQLENQSSKGEGERLLDPQASSLTFYEKGAWALFALRNKIGDKAFKKGIKRYLKKFQFRNATVNDFLREIEGVWGKSLSDFRLTWLENEKFPTEKAKALLNRHSSSIKLLSDMNAELLASQSDDVDYMKYWNASNSIHFKKHLLRNYQYSLPEAIYEKAFESDTVPIRQALLLNRDLPKYLNKERLMSFLKDQSYVTIENLLLSVWQAYPEELRNYLDATEDVIGLPNKNVRLLWLLLAIITENYNGPRTKDYFDELSGYTDENYSFETRQRAFLYLNDTFGLNKKSLSNLVKATDHHAWQFKKFARNLLGELLDDADYRKRLQELSKELKPEESRYLRIKLKDE